MVNKSAANSAFSSRDRVVDSLYKNRRRLATGCAMVVAAAFGYFAVAGENGITVFKQKRADEKQLAHQIETLKQENSQLQMHIERLNKDPEAIEHEARNRGYVKPGDVIYALPDAPPSSQATTPPHAVTSSNK